VPRPAVPAIAGSIRGYGSPQNFRASIQRFYSFDFISDITKFAFSASAKTI
jgi:hypothetical protein